MRKKIKWFGLILGCMLGISNISMPVNTSADTVENQGRDYTEDLPPYDVVDFLLRTLNEQVALSVPGDWGNNGTEGSLTSYSPVNDSGAINPGAGTLNTSYCIMPAGDEVSSFEEYIQNIEKLSIVSDVEVEEAIAAGCTAKRVSYIMTVGSNVFYCENFCIAYEGNFYWVELLQGNKSPYNYFPVLDATVESLSTDPEMITQAVQEELITEAEPTEAPEPEEEVEPTEAPEPEEEAEPTEIPEPEEEAEPTETPEPEEEAEPTEIPEPEEEAEPTETPEAEVEPTETPEAEAEVEPTETPEAEAEVEPTEIPEPEEEAEPTETPEPEQLVELPQEIPVGGVTEASDDLASFTYTMEGTTYQFPTAVEAITDSSFPLDRSAVLPETSVGSAEDIDAALADSQLFRYSTDIYTEMIGVTNVSGEQTQVGNGVITALVDTQAAHLDLTLPGNVKIGEPVINLISSFPEFYQVSVDGEAVYKDDNTIYAANYKEDGCYGYVIIKGNAPYYSALSIVCDNGTIREISFECLGAAQVARFFS